jgi:hypothetical protein
MGPQFRSRRAAGQEMGMDDVVDVALAAQHRIPDD